jgi:CheY-specific phosphatase CheX
MSTLPPEVAEAFTSAAITTLHELVQIDASTKSPGHQAAWKIDGPVVIATIQLVRNPPGSLSLVLASDTAANLASRYIPAGTSLTPEIIDDVVGEFANVIAGLAKTMLKGTPYHFNLSIPVVERFAYWENGTLPDLNMTVRLSGESRDYVLQATMPVEDLQR